MTQPPSGQPAPPPGYGPPAPVPAPGPGYAPYGPPQPVVGPGYGGYGPPPPGPASGSRRGAKIAAAGAAGVVALGLLGGGAVFAYSKVNGGGPQPEEALPADVIAFAKVDLDPSAGQKVDAYRFARKFPGSKDTVGTPSDDADPRQVVFDAIKKSGGLSNLDYATDVEPWLGDRFAVAMLPTAAGAEPEVLLALATTDVDAARAGLSKATSADGGYCAVPGDFAICGQNQAVVDKAVNDAKGASLSGSDTFTDDMKALGEDGLVTAWLDHKGLARLTSAMVTGGQDNANADQVSGRTAMALRFDGPHLELAGTTIGTAGAKLADSDGTSIGSLPDDTVAALSVRNLGPAVKEQWPQIEKQGQTLLGQSWGSSLDELRNQTGLSLPDDLVTLLGDDSTLSLGRPTQGKEPVVALRTNGDKGVGDSVASALSSPSMPLTRQDGPDGTLVLATDQGYGQHIGSGSGLGDSKAFTDAVPDADGANAVGFVDVSAFVDSYAGTMTDEERANIEPISAVGISSRTDGDRGEFRLRVTTR